MSNYYISNCCGAEAKYVSSDDVKEAYGQCTKCLEMSGLEAVIDEEN